MDVKDIKDAKTYLQYLIDNWNSVEIPITIKKSNLLPPENTTKTLEEIEKDTNTLNCLTTVIQVLSLAVQRGYVPKKKNAIIVTDQVPAATQLKLVK